MDRCHIEAAKAAVSISVHFAVRRDYCLKNAPELAANHLLNAFAGKLPIEARVRAACDWVPVLVHLRTNVWAYLCFREHECCKWCLVGRGEYRGNSKGPWKKGRRERRVLTVCCHPACCLLLCVCMVLTSSAENFCQVWSGLTFSLSRHVYSSPIPIKISTLSLSLSLCICAFSLAPSLAGCFFFYYYYSDLHPYA